MLAIFGLLQVKLCMNERLKNDLKAAGWGVVFGVVGFVMEDYAGNTREVIERERELRNQLALTIEALQNPTATLEPEITFSPTPTLTTTPSVTNTSTATPTNTLPPTLTSLPMPVQESPSATTEPSATREQIGSGVDVLGPNAVIEDSVWPGGISREITGFSLDEAATVAEIYNGTTAQTNNFLNQQKLAAARAFAQSIFGVRGLINVNTLTAEDGHWVTGGIDGNEVLVFRIYKEQAPPGYTYNQIAVEDSQPGTAYVNNGSLIGGEFLYVVEVYNAGSGVLENTLTYRSACGNIGGPTVLPQTTPGATVTLVPSPTRPFWPTDTTPHIPPTITPQLPEATITPDLSTATIPPTITPQRPEPTVTPG